MSNVLDEDDVAAMRLLTEELPAGMRVFFKRAVPVRAWGHTERITVPKGIMGTVAQGQFACHGPRLVQIRMSAVTTAYNHI